MSKDQAAQNISLFQIMISNLDLDKVARNHMPPTYWHQLEGSTQIK